MSSWRRLTFTIPDSAREDLLVCLHEMGCLGAESAGDGAQIAWFDGEVDERDLVERLRLALGPQACDMALAESAAVPDGFWHERWVAALRPIPVGRTLLVVPGPATPPASELTAGRRAIRLTPGRAFGTGEHATTRLCLVLLERTLRAGDRFLDVGTGSGILAIAARHLGASEVVAIDTDPAALAVAARNVAINQTPGIAFVAGSPEALAPAAFDLVAANITGASLVRMMGTLAALAGRALILSGILAEETAEVAAAARRRGLAVVENRSEGEWSALLLARGARV